MSLQSLLRAAILAAFLTPALAIADAVVTFNELNYNPPVSQDEEWIELHNQMSVNIDMSGWKLADGISFTFPMGTIIPAGGHIVIAKNPTTSALAGVAEVLGPWSGSLSNSGETIDLLSRSGRVMDRLTYSDSGKWPLAADGVGATLAKREPGLPTDDPTSWTAGPALGGTPGTANFPPPAAAIQHPLITATTEWKYNDTVVAPPASWSAVSFNDSAWLAGQAPFGTTGSEPVLTVTADLVSRYRAGAITGVADGATFSTWSDTATNDGVAQDTTAGGNPTFRASATPSGEPVVRFDGNDQFRAALPPGITASSGFVYFVVCKANAIPNNGGLANGSGDYIFDRDVSVSEMPLISLKAINGRYGFQKREDSGNNLGGPVSTTAISRSRFQIVAVRRNPAAARYEIWVDGVMENSVPDGGDNITPQPIVIGRHASSVSQGFNGDIAELLIYKSGLSAEEFESVGAYLSSRYGLTTAFPETTVATPLATATATSYFRQSFEFSGNPARTELRLDHTIADGAVIYLNGQEIQRTNLPSGTITHTTPALSNIAQPSPTGFQSISTNALVQGTNVLAVSLHKAAGSSSSFFIAKLAGTEQPMDTTAVADLKISEIAGVSDPAFFIELHNSGSAPVSTDGFVLSTSGGAAYTLPAETVPAGGFVSYGSAQLGFVPAADQKIALIDPAARIADVQLSAEFPGGTNADHPGQWMRPSMPTPGAANQFALTTDIVINEICYQSPPLPAIAATPPTVNNLNLVSYQSVWRYNEANASLAADWATNSHAVGNGWQSGKGVFAYSTNTLPLGVGTALTNPALNSPRVITYYFETNFTLSADNAANLSSLAISHLIDDGAVIYLNGIELMRYNMPAGVISSSTLAISGIPTAAVIGPITVAVPAGVAVAGSNRLSVQVHQNSGSSSDVVFGIQVAGTVITDPGTPEIPAAPSNQQWIELYNKGDSTVDLAGWRFAQGIDYTFPVGTVMAPDSYLVITRDGTAPAAVPSLAVLGPFSGKLSGSGERLLLVDAAGNPANDLSYVDGGRWPSTPDGGGTTLELRDPRADNSIPEAWAASDESANRQWETFTYEGVATPSAVGPDGQWQEFILGLLDDGEVLLDDISVIENPSSGGTPMIAGGDFESSTSGWRFLGNHSDARVVADPENPSNHVLYLRATGPTEHMHNHVETTFINSRTVTNGQTYRISFRARWLSGINKLNTRLYFNRLARTTLLSRNQAVGTPGAANSTLEANVGPGFTAFTHSPVVPEPGQPVTVSARAADPDGVANMTLYYSHAGSAFVSVPMVVSSDGKNYRGEIPGFTASSVVRFYVEAADAASLPATSWFPADGPESHALYQVNDGLAATNGLNNIRIIMDPIDKAKLYRTNNLMSNGRIGATMIYRESEIYYNVGVRLKSSQRGRQNAARVGFNIGFNNDQKFRGSLKTIAIDRSEGQITGAQELLYDQMMYASGGIPGEFNDLCKVIAPDPAHTSTAILQLARYSSDYLDSQFDNGSDGTVYEYELIYYPTQTDGDGYKVPQPDNVVGVGVTSLGDDKENYRWTYLTKNNEEKDDYARVIAMAKLFDTSGPEFDGAVDTVLDVDQWLRATAYSCATGAGDSFFSNARHNGQFYARPSDGRMLYFPHDMDFAFNATMGIFTNTELQKLTVNPARKRLYLGHLYDICTTVFNRSYMSTWTSHFGSLLPNENFPGHLNYIDTRSNYILSQVNASIAPVTFAITTNGGADFTTSDSPVVLTGQGWVDVHSIQLAGSGTPLPVIWTSQNTWQVSVPLNGGPNLIQLNALDPQGAVVGSDAITVTNTGNIELPSLNNLVISEIYYNPLVANDVSEYVELLNISSTAVIDLSGLSFTAGIGYTFPGGTRLQPGARIVVIKNKVGFEAEFGSTRPVAGGEFTGALDNAGETLTLTGANGMIVRSFAYSDDPPWPTLPDTHGFSLVLISPFSNPDHSDPLSWRASVQPGGTPGDDDTMTFVAWQSGYGNPEADSDEDGDGWSALAEYILGGNPTVPDHGLAPTFSVHAGGEMSLSITRRADLGGASLVPEISTNLINWETADAVLLRNDRIGGTPAVDRLSFRISSPTGATRVFVRFRMTAD